MWNWMIHEWRAGNRWVIDGWAYEVRLAHVFPDYLLQYKFIKGFVSSFIYRIRTDMFMLLRFVSWLKCINLNASMHVLYMKEIFDKRNLKSTSSHIWTELTDDALVGEPMYSYRIILLIKLLLTYKASWWTISSDKKKYW